ncbi:MAG: S41 family peptidase [Bacteroidaceae bacterium]|nr:S41 family peptidase [Bacteroidaceae bacterium]
MKKKDIFVSVLALATVLILGYSLGMLFSYRNFRKQAARLEYVLRMKSNNNKLSALLTSIEQLYVDSVKVDSIIEKVLPDVLKELDPHSAYFPAEETKESNDELHGSFSGIGIQFSIQEDTIHVNSVIHGGPSEKVGLQAGDRIVYIDDSLFAGKKIDSNDAVKHLKGPEGSEVKVGILRPGNTDIVDFTIVRGPIPVKSVDAAYMVNDEVGYIELNKFGETTYQEMMVGLAALSHQGMKRLVVDLRGNTGGYLGAAIQIVNEFLPKGQMIVYTEGAHSKYAAEYANGRGRFQDIPMVVMIDESSASASEIFTGAIQDNDRGLVVGRRSYGKGLVQQPIDFTDGSSIRLTIARYYTPSGRCIQKPYGEGEDDYSMDLLRRYERGEFFSEDSIHQNQDLVYTTRNGRTVYGGGGIMPDHFVPQDTIGYNEYYSQIVRKSLVNKFVLKHVDQNRSALSSMKEYEEVLGWMKSNGTYSQFLQFVDRNGVKRPGTVPADIVEQLQRLLSSNMIYNVMDMQEYLKYINSFDPTVKKALEVLATSGLSVK